MLWNVDGIYECRLNIWMWDSKSSCLGCVLVTGLYHYWLWIKEMFVSVVWNFLLSFEWKWLFQLFRAQVKKSVVSVVTALSCGFLVLKHVLWIVEYGWLALRKRKIEEDKTDSMLWLGFNKLLKILIGDEHMEVFMDDATLKVSIFL